MKPATSHGFVFDYTGNPITFPLPQGYALANVLVSQSDADKASPEVFLQIEKDNLAGVCDASGKIIIEPKYETRFTYSDGYFTAWTADKQDTVLFDHDGKALASIPIKQYCIVGPFEEGLVSGICSQPPGATGGSRSVCFFHPDGTIAPLGHLFEGLYFSEGLAAVGLFDESGRFYYGFIDKTGKVLGDTKFVFGDNMNCGNTAGKNT
jgi:hypothetical protein